MQLESRVGKDPLVIPVVVIGAMLPDVAGRDGEAVVMYQGPDESAASGHL